MHCTSLAWPIVKPFSRNCYLGRCRRASLFQQVPPLQVWTFKSTLSSQLDVVVATARCACSVSGLSLPKTLLCELRRGLSRSTTARSKQYSTNGSLFRAPIVLAVRDWAICCHKPSAAHQTPVTTQATAHVPGNGHRHKVSEFCPGESGCQVL